jgi:hypothetical protein
MLKPHDIPVVFKYALMQDQYPTFEQVAKALGMTASNVHLSVQRSLEAQLLEQPGKRDIKAIRSHLLEFLTHGARYAFYAERGALMRGTPTAHAAPPLNALFTVDKTPPVWPSHNGTAFGTSLQPLFKTAAFAVQNDPKLYELLALTDALRAGKIRERKLGAEYLKKRLEGDWS